MIQGIASQELLVNKGYGGIHHPGLSAIILELKMGNEHNHTNHDHGHSHSHGHSHGPKSYNRAFAIGIALNIGFVVIESVYGYLSNSLALMSDAGHNLSDVLSWCLPGEPLCSSNGAPHSGFHTD